MPKNASDSPEYEVGFCRPPNSTRFRKGLSGNPRGRPKGSKNIATIVREIAHERVVVTVNGRKKRMSKLAAMLTQIANKGVTGDSKAARELLEWLSRYPELEETSPGSSGPSESDAVVMQGIVERLRIAQTVELITVVDPNLEVTDDPQ